MYKVIIYPLFLFSFLLQSCKEEVLPKPSAELRLEYDRPEWGELNMSEFHFQYNKMGVLENENGTSITLEYPKMKGEIFINYKKVDNNIDKLLSDAQKFSYEHTAKADAISEQPFINDEHEVYGMLYEVSGDAASQAQFYLTDSTTHFVTGSLYFLARPNYDSIYPAAAYLREDIRRIMETLRWNE